MGIIDLEKHFAFQKQLELKINNKELLTDQDASSIINGLLDTLIEVGNGGITDAHLHEEADRLFALRDYWFKQKTGK